MATRTHCVRIATLLRRQNISLCALLISRPSYYHPIHTCIFQMVSFLQFTHEYSVCVYVLTHLCRMPRLSHHSWSGHRYNVCREMPVMKLLSIRSAPSSCYFFSIRPRHLLSPLFCNTHNLCSSITLINQVSHLRKTRFSVIFKFVSVIGFFNTVLLRLKTHLFHIFPKWKVGRVLSSM